MDFKRSTEGFTKSTLDRSTMLKFKLDSFYKNLIQQTRERESRRRELTEKFKEISEDDEQKKQQLINNLAQREANFLRLRRVRLGVSDFTTIKVIGKGAFGEVK
jgi:protein-serine/threonine kinase